ncbi:hypothetical protein GGTG_02527 [Gaeumannomyces tritici R3-111a-1]|uniref:cellulase n=1 Tax=Gaeumannomyces tritici (strain R3-111a-1) TaxID=644352 RepID=J3NMM1_GAET3|nr:hypothetical protein GGTG_02527 [Gaeumannomyces tritici R3-111a-1]EJT82554.1 hypothetical protein GGTG_02527 [Gaeumannomyces tritici R3-111a-1]
MPRRQASGLAGLLPLALALATLACAQQMGEGTEAYPELPTQFCTRAGGCATKRTKLVASAALHNMYWDGDKTKPCAAALNTTAECAFDNGDAAACTKKCTIEPMGDYGRIGVSTKGDALTMRLFMPNANGTGYTRINPQVYLLGEDGKGYEMFRLVNQELTFDVDMSSLGCGLNGALYFSEMDASGSRGELNPAGAARGTGEAMGRGMVLVFSIWNSLTGDNMNWLDSGAAGPCGPDEGSPEMVLARNPNVAVTFSNIRWGELDTTYQRGG